MDWFRRLCRTAQTDKVLMLGFMNQEALDKSRELGKVTFFSRSKNRLWTKGEESGHFLILKDIKLDCDRDTLLIKRHTHRAGLSYRGGYLLG